MGVPILCLSRLCFWIHEICPFLLPSFPLCLSSLSHSSNKHSDEHKVALQLWGWYDTVRQGKTWVDTEYEHVESEPTAGDTQKTTSSFTKEMMVKRGEFSRRLWRRQWHPTPVLLPGESQGGGAWEAAVHGVARSQTWLSDFTFTFHCHALEKQLATHSSVLAWRIAWREEPGGLPSMGLHRVGHDWSNLTAAARCVGLQRPVSRMSTWNWSDCM